MSRHSRIEEEKPSVAASPHLIAAREELAKLDSSPIWQVKSGAFTFRVHCQGQSLWTIIEGPGGGAVASRSAYVPGRECAIMDVAKDNASVRVSLESSIGVSPTQIRLPTASRPLLHW